MFKRRPPFHKTLRGIMEQVPIRRGRKSMPAVRRAPEYSSDEEPQFVDEYVMDPVQVQEEISLEGMDHYKKKVQKLSDEELFNALRQYEKDPGPILASTRPLYEKMLIKLLSKNHAGDGDGLPNELPPEPRNGFSDSDNDGSQENGENGEDEYEANVEEDDRNDEEEDEEGSDNEVDPTATTEEDSEDEDIAYNINTRKYYSKATIAERNGMNGIAKEKTQTNYGLQIAMIIGFLAISASLYYFK